MFKKSILMASILSATAVMTGCGGGEGGSTPSANPGQGGSQQTSLSGVVADGYLSGATVCWDANLNGACDVDEPSATTDAQGAYSLNVTGIDLTTGRVLVEVSETTIDSDTGLAVGTPYKLKAPNGKHEFISPVSTMIADLQDQNSGDLDAAESDMKGLLNLSDGVDLYADFIDEGQNSVNLATDYKIVHQVAQTLVRTIQKHIGEHLARNNQVLSELTPRQLAELQDRILDSISDQVVTVINGAKNHINTNGTVDTDFADNFSGTLPSLNLEVDVTDEGHPEEEEPVVPGLAQLIDYTSGMKDFEPSQVIATNEFLASMPYVALDGSFGLKVLNLKSDGYFHEDSLFDRTESNVDASRFGEDSAGNLTVTVPYDLSNEGNPILDVNPWPTYGDSSMEITGVSIEILNGRTKPIAVNVTPYQDALGQTLYNTEFINVEFGPGDHAYLMSAKGEGSGNNFEYYNKSALQKIMAAQQSWYQANVLGLTPEDDTVSALEALNNAGGSLSLYTGFTEDEGQTLYVQASILESDYFYRGIPTTEMILNASSDQSISSMFKGLVAASDPKVQVAVVGFDDEGGTVNAIGIETVKLVDLSGDYVANFSEVTNRLPTEAVNALSNSMFPANSLAYIVTNSLGEKDLFFNLVAMQTVVNGTGMFTMEEARQIEPVSDSFTSKYFGDGNTFLENTTSPRVNPVAKDIDLNTFGLMYGAGAGLYSSTYNLNLSLVDKATGQRQEYNIADNFSGGFSDLAKLSDGSLLIAFSSFDSQNSHTLSLAHLNPVTGQSSVSIVSDGVRAGGYSFASNGEAVYVTWKNEVEELRGAYFDSEASMQSHTFANAGEVIISEEQQDFFPSVKMLSNGDVEMAVSESLGATLDSVKYMTRSAETGVWASGPTLSTETGFVGDLSAAYSGDNLHVSWIQYSSTTASHNVYYASRIEGSWTTTEILSIPGNKEQKETLSLTALDGRVGVTWAQDAGSFNDVYVAESYNGVWGDTEKVYDLGGLFPKLGYDEYGNAILAFYNYHTQVMTKPVGGDWTTAIKPADLNSARYLDLVMDRAGNAMVAWNTAGSVAEGEYHLFR